MSFQTSGIFNEEGLLPTDHSGEPRQSRASPLVTFQTHLDDDRCFINPDKDYLEILANRFSLETNLQPAPKMCSSSMAIHKLSSHFVFSTACTRTEK